MGQRVQLQSLLETLLGSRNVYFQPPSNINMMYPCIVYKRDNVDVKFADNGTYSRIKRYLVTVIDKNPDSVLPDKVAELRHSTFSRHFTADNLNHDVYTLYF